jgi:hypothetical protein
VCARLSFVVAALLLYGCSFSADYGDAIVATAIFHRLVDAGQYEVIYDTAARKFQATGSRDQFVGLLIRVNRKMGRCEATSCAVSGYQATGGGTFVSTNSSRACANGKLDEKFVWLMIKGKATLLAYNASSPLLLTD